MDCGEAKCDHFKCKLASLQVSPSATPSRRNNKPPRGSHNNAWEKGVHRFSDGSPVRSDEGKVIGLREKSTSEVDRMLRKRSERSKALRRT